MQKLIFLEKNNKMMEEEELGHFEKLNRNEEMI